MREHLLCDGFLRSYTTWTWHGTLLNLPRVSVTEEYVGSTMDEVVHDDVDDDRLEDMIRDVGAESFAKAMDMKVCQAMQRLHCILDQLTSHGCRRC